MTWDGTKRRFDDDDESVKTRIALLERFALDADKRHKETTDWMRSICEKIESVKEDIFKRMDSEKEDCIQYQRKVDGIINTSNWYERCLYGLGLAGLTIAGWIFNHSIKVPK